MRVGHIEFLVEEQSMEIILRSLVPLLVTEATFEVYPTTGKAKLLAQLPARLKAYAKWLPADARVVVLVDRDGDECLALKKRLKRIGDQAGFASDAGRLGIRRLLFRIAIEELEAWYFGDWQAVLAAYPRVPEMVPTQARFRNPDAIQGGTWEAFEEILQKSGYFPAGLAKLEAARRVGPHLNPKRNVSPSFAVFRKLLEELAA